MPPHVLVVYSSALFAEGLAHLLAGRSDCAMSGTVSAASLTVDRLSQTQATIVILEGDDADPAVVAAMRALQGRGAAFALIRVNLSAPTLRVYYYDRPVPAGLDELTEVIRRLADQPAAPTVGGTPVEARA